jgi:phosphomannomutase/phosphoglucomutase
LANLLTTIEGMNDFAGLSITSIATTDGIRLNLAGGFWLVRLSNTEPCLTLRAEATSPQQLAQVEAGLVDLLNQHIVQVLPQWTPEQGKPPADH